MFTFFINSCPYLGLLVGLAGTIWNFGLSPGFSLRIKKNQKLQNSVYGFTYFHYMYVSNFTYLVGLFLGFAGKFGFSPCFILRDNWYEPVSKAFLAFFWSFSWIITDNSLVLQLWCEPEKVASNLTIGLLVRFGLVNAMGISSKSTDSLTVKCENLSIYCYKNNRY